MLKSIEFNNWNQFEKIDIEFNSNLTILTGVNGSGKSTILRILGRLLGWEYREIAKPISKMNTKMRNYSPNYLLGSAVADPIIKSALEEIIKSLESKANLDSKKDEYDYYNEEMFTIGNIRTENKPIFIKVPKETEDALYTISLVSPKEYVSTTGEEDSYSYYELDEQIGVKGVNIPSHRMPYFYNNLDTIHARMKSKNTFYNEYMQALSDRQISGGYYDAESNPFKTLKSSIITAAIYSEGNSFIGSTNSTIFKDLIALFKIMLPQTFKFDTLRIEDGEIILVTGDGDILLDSVSSGIGSIIDLTWQIYMGQPEDPDLSFLVLVDEVENHLHPSMQRSILPKLVSAFPNAQFIVTTHSPLVVNSVENAFVYALKYNENNKIFSEELNFKDNFSNSMEVLRSVLEVPVTIPLWAEEKLMDIVNKSLQQGLSDKTFEFFSSNLDKSGLRGLMPEAIRMLEKGYKND
ncbi:MAG: AAA family ATPase [Bacillota bacterium]